MARFFIQFAGQGMRYLDELRKVYRAYPTVKPWIVDAARTVLEQAARYDDSETRFYTAGLDLIRWLDHPDEAPDFAYLLSSPVSHPLIFTTQFANYLALLADGADHQRLISQSVATTGFSTGIVASLLTALDLPEAQLRQRALAVQAMFFWQGVRCQQSILGAGAQVQLSEELHQTAAGCPSCMASIDGLLRSKLDGLISEFDRPGKVSLAYMLMPFRCIVAGLPADLNDFDDFLRQRELKYTWRYVPSTIAAHSPLLQHAYDTTPADAASVGLRFDSSELALPVLSNDGGKDLRDSADIIDDVMRAYFLDTGLWRQQIAPLFKSEGVTHVLSFGPGSGVAGLTELHLAKFEIKVVRCAVALERKMLVKELANQLS